MMTLAMGAVAPELKVGIYDSGHSDSKPRNKNSGSKTAVIVSRKAI